VLAGETGCDAEVTDMDRLEADISAGGVNGRSRLVVYALPDVSGRVDEDPLVALEALRPHADRLVVVTTGDLDVGSRERLCATADDLIHYTRRGFSRSLYGHAVDASARHMAASEIVLTGASWFAPREVSENTLAGVFDEMATSSADVWELVEQTGSLVRDFGPQGFPLREEPYLWLALRGAGIRSSFWSAADPSPAAARASAIGLSTGALFSVSQTASPDPVLLQVPWLLSQGLPVLPKRPFVQYPPFLEQHAVIGKEILAVAAATGFDTDRILAALTRSVPAKALNTNLGLLDVIPSRNDAPASASARGRSARTAPRILVVMHVTDMASGTDALRRLLLLPEGFDLLITTTDGSRAARLARLVEDILAGHVGSREVRVAPVNRGRDMSALFIASRDVLLAGEHDLLLRLYCRPMGSKTRVVRHYFRRYQFENLLASRDHVARVLRMFEEEPGLGMVFPPMIHIGFQTLGRGWGEFRDGAVRLARRLGVRVPLDVVSPLAPFGGMFFARPGAIEPLARVRWTYREYEGSSDPGMGDLARVQVRMLTTVAAANGYHARTVLTPEHAAISHTSLEFKADEISSTTRGYPVDRIQLLHRAGPTGRGGVVGLSRMYLRLNHPLLASVVLPAMAAAERGFMLLRDRRARWRVALSRFNRKGASR
jgi:lipopolysaccharide biosynthesis protein